MAARRRAFSDPTRVRIREALASGEQTVRQLGQQLGVEPNRLYYHLRILEAAELVEVVGTLAEGRMVEKIYGAAGGSFGSDLPGEDATERIAFFHSLLDATKADLTDVIFEQVRQVDAGETPLKARLIKGLAFATTNDVDELAADFDKLLADYAKRATTRATAGEELTAYPFTFAIYERPRTAEIRNDTAHTANTEGQPKRGGV
jgi:DNA-binding transcriptional ArsR family regulator